MSQASGKIIGQSFVNVFNSLNYSTEAWFQQKKLLSIGEGAYVKYIQESVGRFPLFGTSLFSTIEQSYVDVKATSVIENEVYKPKSEIEATLRLNNAAKDENKQIAIVDVFEKECKRVALVGNPGTGKTTELKYLAIYAASGNKIDGKVRIPIFIPLKDIRDKESLISRIHKTLDRYGVEEPELVAGRLLKKGLLLLLIDGLDEVEPTRQREYLRELKDTSSFYDKCFYCISGRPMSLSIGIPGFKKFQTVEFHLSQQLTFIKKWFLVVDPKKGIEFASLIKSDPGFLDLGRTPLMLSLMCALFNNDLNIPRDLDELYSRSVEGLLGHWDHFRSIVRNSVLSDLSMTKRLLLVNSIAAATFSEKTLVFGVHDIESTSFLERIERRIRQPIPECRDILNSLCQDFGIIVERAPGMFSFSHLTLHEYLVSKHIVDQRREINLVAEHGSSPRWDNVILLTAKQLTSADDFMIAVLDKYATGGGEREIRLLLEILKIEPILSNSATDKMLVKRLYGLFEFITRDSSGVQFELKKDVSEKSWRLSVTFANLGLAKEPPSRINALFEGGIELYGILRSNIKRVNYKSAQLDNSVLKELHRLDFPEVSEIIAYYRKK